MRTMSEIAAITVHITSPSCAIWPLISCPRNPPRAPCVSKSNGPVGRTPISQSSSPKSEVRLPWNGFDGRNGQQPPSACRMSEGVGDPPAGQRTDEKGQERRNIARDLEHWRPADGKAQKDRVARHVRDEDLSQPQNAHRVDQARDGGEDDENQVIEI